jgi:predicted enzyme related to lactoylglutathione lyase
MPNPVVHFEVTGKDPGALTKFYGDAFGWQLEDVMQGSYFMANTGGEHDIPGGIGGTPEPGGGGYVTFYVQVDDPAVALEKIESLGGKTVMAPMDIPEGPTIAQFADPEGHVVGLVKAP